MPRRPAASHRDPWYNRWYVPGAIAFGGGLLILFLEAVFRTSRVPPPVIGPISLLIALLSFSLGWTLERHRKTIEERIREEGSGLRGVTEPYLLYLRDQMQQRVRRPLSQLADESRSLKSVSDCTTELREVIDGLHERVREILAVCGQKAWDDPDVQAYYEANYRKAEQGIKIKRIFIQEPGKRFSPAEKTVLRDHLDARRENVEARVIFAEDFHHLTHYRFPPGFGFAILGGTVIVHWGFGTNTAEAGRRFEDPWFVDEHRRIHSRLWSLAKGATDNEKARIAREILETQ
ncbi:MAG TPA: hypothetical protein VGC93_13640 [Thermoanaerobaculia bacterium]